MKLKFPQAFAVLALLTFSQAHSATLLSWSLSPDAGLTPGTPSPATNVSGGTLTRGSGMSVAAFGNQSTTVIAGSSLNTVNLDLNAYVEFSIAPQVGYTLNLDTLEINTRTSQSTITWTVRSSLDTWGVDLITPTTSTDLTSVALSSAFDNLTSATTFRIYFWAASTGGAQGGLDNGPSSAAPTIVTGTVTAVPEPSTILLLSLACVGVVLWRRPRFGRR